MSLLVENRTSIQVIQSTRVLRAFRFVINQPLTKPKSIVTLKTSVFISIFGAGIRPLFLPIFLPSELEKPWGGAGHPPSALTGWIRFWPRSIRVPNRQWDSNFHQVKSQRSSPPYLHHIPFPWGFSHKPSLLQHLNFSLPMSLTT